MRNKLHYYRNKNEFDKLYNESENAIIPFEFAETKIILENEKDKIIDITNLVSFIETSQSNIYSAIINLNGLNEENKIVINKDWCKKALYYFPTIFDETIPLYDEEESSEISFNVSKKALYYYNEKQFTNLIEYCEKNKIILTNFANLQNENNFENSILLDITTTLISIQNAPQLIFLLEQFFSKKNDKITIIIDEKQLEEAQLIFKPTFKEYKNISELYSEVENLSLVGKERTNNIVKITDLNNEEIEKLFSDINNKLIGHHEFKRRLIIQLRKFLVLNKIGQRKIFSMFLLGKPGLGKTEIGKIISNSLNCESKIIKINFGNYSSQDALNSLIGSPAGYIGCEGGELGKKVLSNKVGVIICDEFEKADSEIKNFFLELLEDGRFTDSMSREYDLNGYIIIFTSNIKNENEFKNKMSPEFESRVNLICEFDPLTKKEKEKYVKFQIDCCIEKMTKEGIDVKFSDDDIEIDVDDTNDLREIKNRILNKISEFI